MRRTATLVLLLAAFGIAAVLATRPSTPPELSFDDAVPSDLRTLALETWDDFLGAHPARHGCIAPVTLVAAWELDTRAEYRPASATLLVRVPGTPATLRSEMIHEFAHHLEFTCPEQTELRGDFLRAQQSADDTPWFEGATWEATPSEQYAEATVELIEGRRSHLGGIRLTPDAVEVVRAWGRGS